jgi:SAM-dependent methyltransferase
MFETSKALRRRIRDPQFTLRYFVGSGIDIGSGPDPLARQVGFWPGLQECDEWDKEDGDAQLMEDVAPETFDFVYSSHTLEHVDDADIALARWWEILKPGGHLILIVPDEDLYEQGMWPPTFNTDHRRTFAVAKASSWSPVSRNIDEMLKALGGEIVKIERIEEGFVVGAPRVDQTSVGLAESCIECVVRKPRR